MCSQKNGVRRCRGSRRGKRKKPSKVCPATGKSQPQPDPEGRSRASVTPQSSSQLVAKGSGLCAPRPLFTGWEWVGRGRNSQELVLFHVSKGPQQFTAGTQRGGQGGMRVGHTKRVWLGFRGCERYIDSVCCFGLGVPRVLCLQGGSRELGTSLSLPHSGLQRVSGPLYTVLAV